MKKVGKVLLGIVIFAAILAVIQFIPTFNLKTSKMITNETSNFIFYYEPNDEKAVKDMENILESTLNKVNSSMQFSSKEKTRIYVYPNINILHTKKYGLLGRIVGPDWYIGDNIGNKIIIVSPLNPGPEHDYNSIVQASVHEYIHTIVYRINKKATKFMNDGLAGYVSGNTKPNYSLGGAPPIEDTRISNPIKFGNKGLYPLSYTYIEFLNKEYGMGKVLELVKRPNDYKQIFGLTEEEIYEKWDIFIKENYK